VAKRRQLGGMEAVGDLEQVAGNEGGLLATAYAGDLGSADRQQSQVARADRPARTGQQGEHRGVGRDVVHQGQRRDDLGHLGQPQQPGEPDDLDRDPGVGQRVEDLRRVRVVAGEHPDVGPALDVGLAVHLADRVGQPGELLALRLEHPGRDDSLGRLGLGPSPRPDAAKFVVISSEKVKEARTAIRLIRGLSVLLWILVAALLIAGFWLAEGWRRRALMITGWTTVTVALAILRAGASIDEFLDGFPTVGRDQVVEFLQVAEKQMEKLAA